MNIYIPTLDVRIDSDHLSGGEEVFLQQLRRKCENGQTLKPGERCFIRDMATRSEGSIKRICYV